jgi:FtsP/CotA-like multicopper oxidase with cupredoxin domain
MTILVPAAFLAVAFAGCFDLGSGDDSSNEAAGPPTVHEFDIQVGLVMLPLYPLADDSATGEPRHQMMMGVGFGFVGEAPTVPGPEIRVTEGDLLRVNFINNDPLAFNHTIHWHGVNVPYGMDGSPYIDAPPTVQGESIQYEFVATPSGTRWYHCHVDVTHHTDLGMYGAIIIEPRDNGDEPKFDRETTLFLDEWDKNHIHSANMTSAGLDPSGDPFATINKEVTQARDAAHSTPEGRAATGGTIREKRDWWPETPPPYFPEYNTFTFNSRSFPYTEPIMIAEGETLKVRLINAGGMAHSLHVHGHSVLVTHKDGNLLKSPYWADTLPISPGERYDFLLEGNNPGVWDFSDHDAGHTANDNVWPGGMMTMIVYEGFEPPEGHGGHVGSGSWGSGPYGELVSGDYVGARRGNVGG